VYKIWRKNFQELLSNHIFGVGSFFKPHPVYANYGNTFRGHSRSRIFGPLKSRRGTAYYCLIWASESEISKKRSDHVRFWERHCHAAPPILESSTNISTSRIFIEIRIIDLHFTADSIGLSVYLHSACSGELRKTIFSTIMRFGRSRSPEVVDFGTNRKRVCDFVLVHHSNFGPIFHPFGDIAGFRAYDPTRILP